MPQPDDSDADVVPEVANRHFGTVYGNVVQAGHIEHLHMAGVVPPVPTPHQLPRVPSGFVNRRAEMAEVDRLTGEGRSDEGPAVVVLTGMHGVGKSATGRHWAHTNAARFADGELYADFGELRHRGGVSVGEVLSGFLRGLGISDEVIPSTLAERASMFRSRTAGQKLLVVLDDVDHAAQVRPLIPNTPTAVVLVTTRAPMEDLLSDGARLVRLPPLDDLSGRALLADMLGDARVESEPAAADDLVDLCAGLPVVLRVCGAGLAAHERRPIRWLVDQLSDEAHRLRRLSVGRDRSIVVVFDEAYRQLDEEVARAYRLVGQHPGRTFGSGVVAAAMEMCVSSACETLDALCTSQLLDEIGPDRFRQHDLLRLHAAELARTIDSDEEQERAMRATVEFYVTAAQRMDRAMIANRLRLAPASTTTDPNVPGFDSAAKAFEWFEAERLNLLAALREAYEHRWDASVWHLGEALFLAYHNHKHFEEAREVYDLSAKAAARCHHLAAEARMRSQLARACIDLDAHETAERELQAARGLAARSGNRSLAASIVEWTGVLEVDRGRYAAGIAAFERAREEFGALGNMRGVALQDYHWGRALDLAGRHDEAIEHLARAERLVDADVDGLTLGRVLLRLGQAQAAAGQGDLARRPLDEAVRVMEANDAPFYAAQAREALAPLELAAGDRAMAREHLQRALAVYLAIGSSRAQRVGAQLETL